MKVHRDVARRAPVPRERYRAVARSAGLAPRLRRALGPLDAVILLAAVAFVLLASPMVGGVIGAGVADVGVRLGELFPANAGTGTIELPGSGGTVSARPVADALPDYTRDERLQLDGRVPSFAIAEGRRVTVMLNAALVTTVTPDAKGAFTVRLALREGTNSIDLALVAGAEVIATSRYSVVLDRQPPQLTVATPADGATLDGPTVAVQGRTEAGAAIVVNGRTVVVGPDGAFTEAVSAPAGSLALTVTARDPAGNETTKKSTVTVKAPAAGGDVTVQVTLDQTRVKPGASVTAQVVVSANGATRANELVTISVGVVTVGSARTDAAGVASVTFTAPSTEGDLAVVVLASSASGRATLTVAK